MLVYCKHCEQQKNVDDCWCVIDTAKKARYFECKEKCLTDPIEQWIRELQPMAEKMEAGIVEIDTAIDDWMEKIPKQSWIEWFKSFFGLSGIRYIKVKTS